MDAQKRKSMPSLGRGSSAILIDTDYHVSVGNSLSKMDCPPLLPRSPSACKTTNEKISTFGRSFSCETAFAKMTVARRTKDLPPWQPRSRCSVDIIGRSSVRRVDSAPTIPKELMQLHPPQSIHSALITFRSSSSHCEKNSHRGRFSAAPHVVSQTSVLATMLGEALAILESEE